MDQARLTGLATDARINERLIARGLDPMKGPILSDILLEALGQKVPSDEALRVWKAQRLAADARIAAVLRRYDSAA